MTNKKYQFKRKKTIIENGKVLGEFEYLSDKPEESDNKSIIMDESKVFIHENKFIHISKQGLLENILIISLLVMLASVVYTFVKLGDFIIILIFLISLITSGICIANMGGD
jgi:hypothetical protein